MIVNVVIRGKLMLGNIKQFFGFFNLTEFENVIIDELKKHLSSDQTKALDDQMDRFNKIDRVLEPKEDLKFGHTSFYWIKGGKAKLDFPYRFETNKEEDVLAMMDVRCLDNNIVTKVTFILVNGFLFSVEYRSKSDSFLPKGEFKIENVEVLI